MINKAESGQPIYGHSNNWEGGCCSKPSLSGTPYQRKLHSRNLFSIYCHLHPRFCSLNLVLLKSMLILKSRFLLFPMLCRLESTFTVNCSIQIQVLAAEIHGQGTTLGSSPALRLERWSRESCEAARYSETSTVFAAAASNPMQLI